MLRVKAERLARGWTQQTLAYKAKMGATDISRIENGIMIPYKGWTARLSHVLRIPQGQLLEWVEPEPPIDPPEDMIRKMDEMTKEMTGDNR